MSESSATRPPTIALLSSLPIAVYDEAVRRAVGEEIVIPFGVGIAGSVAETKDVINIKNAYDDPRFNCEIDQKTGYKTNAMLSMPISNYEGDVIGVAQIINKTNGKPTTTILSILMRTSRQLSRNHLKCDAIKLIVSHIIVLKTDCVCVCECVRE